MEDYVSERIIYQIIKKRYQKIMRFMLLKESVILSNLPLVFELDFNFFEDKYHAKNEKNWKWKFPYKIMRIEYLNGKFLIALDFFKKV